MRTLETPRQPVAFTHMSDDALAEILRRLPERYEMSLNRADMSKLVQLLFVGRDIIDEMEEFPQLVEWIENLVSEVASTVGVEVV